MTFWHIYALCDISLKCHLKEFDVSNLFGVKTRKILHSLIWNMKYVVITMFLFYEELPKGSSVFSSLLYLVWWKRGY